MITMQTVAIEIAITAHPTVTVVRMATNGTSESLDWDHFDPKIMIKDKTYQQIIFKFVECFLYFSQIN